MVGPHGRKLDAKQHALEEISGTCTLSLPLCCSAFMRSTGFPVCFHYEVLSKAVGLSTPELKPQGLKGSLFSIIRFLGKLFCYIRKANDSVRMLRSWNTKFCTRDRVVPLNDSQVTSWQDNSEARESQCGAAERASLQRTCSMGMKTWVLFPVPCKNASMWHVHLIPVLGR